MSTQAPRQMHLGAFLFNLGNHVAAWRHPDTPVAGLMELGFYRRLAQAARAESRLIGSGRIVTVWPTITS
jgi:hypothetical protein